MTTAKITCCKFYVETLHLFQSNTAALRDTGICWAMSEKLPEYGNGDHQKEPKS